jgi:hypothetical protein
MGWAEPLQMPQMAGISLLARISLTTATNLDTQQPDVQRWVVGRVCRLRTAGTEGFGQQHKQRNPAAAAARTDIQDPMWQRVNPI